MTTAAMVAGMVPLILASGAGARSRFSIGLTIFFGMAIGTAFTLFVTPMVYTFLARDHAKAAAGQGVGHVAVTGETPIEGSQA
jgi:Cu/Ag efflux pump CusA